MTSPRLAVFILLAVTISSCSTYRLHSPPPGHPPESSPAALMEQKKYGEALDQMREDGAGRPRRGLERDFVTALNKLLEKGEQEMRVNNCGAAGGSFKRVLSDYPVDPALQEKMRWNQTQISEKIETCSAKLMEQGLQEYRKGDLNGAIRTWKKLVSFNPGYQGAQKALDTATMQVRTLQSLNPKKP